MSNMKVLLVDDHSVVRMGFKMLIDSEQDMHVIAEAESGEAGIKSFKVAYIDSRVFCSIGLGSASPRGFSIILILQVPQLPDRHPCLRTIPLSSKASKRTFPSGSSLVTVS